MCYENKCDLYVCRLLRRSSLSLQVLLCIRISASIYRQLELHKGSMTGRCLPLQKFQKGDRVSWVVGFRHALLCLTFMGWERVLARSRVCARVCVCACVEPGPRSFGACGEQTLCTQMHQFPMAAEWCFWSKRERRKHNFPFSSRLGPTCLAQSELNSLKSRLRLITVSKPSAQMGFD